MCALEAERKDSHDRWHQGHELNGLFPERGFLKKVATRFSQNRDRRVWKRSEVSVAKGVKSMAGFVSDSCGLIFGELFQFTNGRPVVDIETWRSPYLPNQIFIGAALTPCEEEIDDLVSDPRLRIGRPPWMGAGENRKYAVLVVVADRRNTPEFGCRKNISRSPIRQLPSPGGPSQDPHRTK
jgi:hypothetical protein